VIRDLRQQGYLIADLAWTKLTGLRETLASLYDEGVLASIHDVAVTYGGDVPSPSAIYFASWIGRAFPDAKVSLKPVEGPRGLRSIKMSGDSEVVITRPDQTTLEIHSGGRIRRSSMQLLSAEILMSEELSILGPDGVFDKALL
jgi:glucose-6-phosphate dehydrogenase assembly protein OpcA